MRGIAGSARWLLAADHPGSLERSLPDGRVISRPSGSSTYVLTTLVPSGAYGASSWAGASLRDVQEAASHADPRATMRYDRARVSLDRHATYVVAAFHAGAAR
jgi:hypothetical protein